MVFSRRDFVRLGSLCFLSAGLSLGFLERAVGQQLNSAPDTTATDFPIPIEAQSDPLFFMSRRTFTQYLETIFIIDPGYTRPIETTLIKVEDTRPANLRKGNASSQECFVLTFRCESSFTVNQGTYQIRHAALGDFELFVVPSEDSEGKMYFQAVINRVEG
jgi:hypothetical protein